MNVRLLAKWLEQFADEMEAAGEPKAWVRDIRQAHNVVRRIEQRRAGK